MVRCASVFGIATAFLFATACSDDSTPPAVLCDDLPQAPQILPNAQGGVVAFGLVTASEILTTDVVFINGGQDDLVASDMSIEGRDAEQFEIVNVTPESRTAECAGSLAARVRFTAPDSAEGAVYIARLVVESNASNFQTLELELVAPCAGERVASEAKLALVESSVDVQAIPGLAAPAAVIRYYNVGGDTLVVDGYAIDDAASFRFLTGTEVPGAACESGGVCEPGDDQAQGCCGTPPLACTNEVCAATRVVSGDFVLFGVRFTDQASGGETTTQVTISSNDPASPATVNVTGTP
jgi:hypothetical protein